jgi:predicted lipoprotein with Yx(FWY)xxD motif
MRRLALLAVTAVAGFAAACGDDDQSPASQPDAGPRVAMQKSPVAAEPVRRVRRGITVKVVKSQFGSILADGRGHAFYYFDKEKTRRSECYGACAKGWPPVLAKGRPVAGRGARRGLIGTTRRRGGQLQVTYRGRPVYYYVHDGPGRVRCHNVRECGGLWLVIRPNGRAVG